MNIGGYYLCFPRAQSMQSALFGITRIRHNLSGILFKPFDWFFPLARVHKLLDYAVEYIGIIFLKQDRIMVLGDEIEDS